MFKYWAIKKYGTKLLPVLQKRYGVQNFYSAHQIRSTVYQRSFNPLFLPLGYILFLEKDVLETVMQEEFPNLCIFSYKKEISSFLKAKHYQGFLQVIAV